MSSSAKDCVHKQLQKRQEKSSYKGPGTDSGASSKQNIIIFWL